MWRCGGILPARDSMIAIGRVPLNSDRMMTRIAVIGTERSAPAMPHKDPHVASETRMTNGDRLSERPVRLEAVRKNPRPYAVWTETSMRRVMPHDLPAAAREKRPEIPQARIQLAGGEDESFQVVLLPAGGRSLRGVQIELGEAILATGHVAIDAPGAMQPGPEVHPDPLLGGPELDPLESIGILAALVDAACRQLQAGAVGIGWQVTGGLGLVQVTAEHQVAVQVRRLPRLGPVELGQVGPGVVNQGDA